MRLALALNGAARILDSEIARQKADKAEKDRLGLWDGGPRMITIHSPTGRQTFSNPIEIRSFLKKVIQSRKSK